MSRHVFETDCRCESCKGTGVYVGFAEKDGAAVVCSRCNGTGKAHIRFEWDDFDGRKRRPGVERVYEVNPGVGVGKHGRTRTFSLSDFGGMPYSDWFAGKPFPPRSEMRAWSCPCWWYQSADYKRKPDWKECNDTLGRSFSQCPHYATKDACWKRWDRENGGAR